MVPANKILTVAYGTFSCTLEGFDDPFSTMTDIAEYFRDLAADDRFFGAEPPTPDMAMLRTIAETRAKHAVTAQPDEGGVTLRPTAVPAPAAMTAAFDAAEDLPPAPQETLVSEPADDTPEEDDTAAIGAAAAPIAETPEAASIEAPEIKDVAVEDDSVAAKLARIRGVVEADRQAAGTYAEDEHADDMMIDATDMADDTLAAAFAADALDEEPGIADARTEADLDDTIASDLAAILAPNTSETPAEPEIETTQDAAPPADAPASEDTMAEMPTAPEAGDASQTEETSERLQRRIRVRKVRRVQAAAEAATRAATDERNAHEPEDDAINVDPVMAGDDGAEDELMAELAAIEAELTRPGPMDDVQEDPARAEEPLTDGDAFDDDDLMAELAALRAEDPIVAEEPGLIEQTPARDATGDETAQDDDAEGLAEAAMTDPEDVRASENDDTTASTDRDAAEVKPETTDPEERTLTRDADLPDAPEEAAEATAPPAPDMERLFAATDSRLSGEDTSRRHANISHLKAAVAARRADGPVEAKEETETDAYRADLANTVRPRRKSLPDDATKRTPRPERAAPLVLVSEQRVENAPEADAAPVEPRRAVRSSGETEVQKTAQAGAEDFETFAATVGAIDLSDILEAAAVYSTKIMGQETFSRPRLLHLAAEAVEEMSREDGLRGFGQLLRDGTIRKVSRGTFTLAAESRYGEQTGRRVG